jgi:predicted enzyme related to lactoylglutathione lyase
MFAAQGVDCSDAAGEELVAQLRVARIEIVVDPQDNPIGRFARLNDPEGNPIEFWEPK